MQSFFSKNRTATAGFSVIEILTVVTILALLLLAAITTLPSQLQKARDGERKSDLQKIKVAFENFYDDIGCYPSATVLDNCGGAVSPHELTVYLDDIPCDPFDETPYLYLPHDSGGGAGTCDGYRVWANLEKEDDPVIEFLNCDSASGCGAFGYFSGAPKYLGEKAAEYNYGVSEGVPVFVGDPETYLDEGWCCEGVCNIWSADTGTCINGPYMSQAECIAVSSCSS